MTLSLVLMMMWDLMSSGVSTVQSVLSHGCSSGANVITSQPCDVPVLSGLRSVFCINVIMGLYAPMLLPFGHCQINMCPTCASAVRTVIFSVSGMCF